MISILAFILAALGGLFLCFAAIAFYRAKDLFVMLQIVSMVNLYVFPIILFAVLLENFSLASFFKIVAIILLNIILSVTLCYTIARKALINKVLVDADEKIL